MSFLYGKRSLLRSVIFEDFTCVHVHTVHNHSASSEYISRMKNLVGQGSSYPLDYHTYFMVKSVVIMRLTT